MTVDDNNPSGAEPRGSNPDPTTVVLVHGAWHGAWCWATLQAELDRRSIPSLAVDLPGHGVSTDPLGGLHDDAAALSAVLDRVTGATGPVVLVGHSYGGAVITQAASGRDDVAHLLYIAAFALANGESVLSCLGAMDRRDVALAAAMVPTDDGTATRLAPGAAAGALYGRCSAEAVHAALARIGPQSMASMTEEISGSPRREIDSTYIRCSEDRAVHPDHQAELADRCARRVDLDTDHSPFLSAVDATADVIEQIASAS
ncbi:alpha/beta fold hydrolase [Ilumatobacter sp.]|uniref:alpha/beta fold hydrolase n=1 Tax=Ilumatobacter sp. TaxID=1967498 RepID=UPI003C61F0BC